MKLVAVLIVSCAAVAFAQRKIKGGWGGGGGGGGEPTEFRGTFNKGMRKVQKEVLARINELRAEHGVAPLDEDEQMNRYAQAWAKYLAKTGRFQHRSQRKYGENIFMSYSSDPNAKLAGQGKKAVESWYSEIKFYQYGNNYNPKAGHFTQCIWRGSRRIGTGVARSPDGKVFIVSNFDPAGNMQGAFRKNVPRPQGGTQQQQMIKG
uniref:Putative scp gapr-1 like: scp-like extracellular protein n=1 Tax=Amblyomma cajennense TaxID=34607 RepID=A0A023FG79_AMBCJ